MIEILEELASGRPPTYAVRCGGCGVEYATRAWPRTILMASGCTSCAQTEAVKKRHRVGGRFAASSKP